MIARKYRGITYPKLFQGKVAHWLWSRFFCPSEIHLFDETLSDKDHYLSCDACFLIVDIQDVDTRYVKSHLRKKNERR